MHTAHSISLVALDDLARLTARATSGACPPSETLKLLQKQAAELMNLALVSAVTAASTTSAHVVSSLPNVGSLLHLARLLLQVRPEAKASSALPVLAGPVGTEDSSSVSFKTNLLNLEKVLSSAVQANKLMNIGNANEDQLKQQNHQHQQIHLEISILQIQEARNRSNITSTSKAAKTMIKTLEMEVIR